MDARSTMENEAMRGPVDVSEQRDFEGLRSKTDGVPLRIVEMQRE